MANTCNCRSLLIGLVLVHLLPSILLSNAAIAEQTKLQLPEPGDHRGGEEAVRLVANDLSLQALALRIEAMSGIHVVIADDLSQTLVNVSVASPNWPAALLELFQDYSTVVAWNARGEVHSVYVLTSATADPDVSAPASEPGPESASGHTILAAIKSTVANPGGTSEAVPEYPHAMTTASVLEFMTASPASISAADNQLQHSTVDPATGDLLQRMRAVDTTTTQAVVAPNGE